jgi:hypothetical protein
MRTLNKPKKLRDARATFFVLSVTQNFANGTCNNIFLFVEDLGMPTSRACFVARFWEVYWPGKTTKGIPIHMKRWLQA